jgi:hypothetical protein
MKSRWKTQKGDEWFYDCGTIQAAGDLHSNEHVFSVRYISGSGGSLTQKQLMRFLGDTKKYFPEVRLLINQGSPESDLARDLKSLRKKGRIGYQTSDVSKSHIEITPVDAKQWWSLW